MVITRQAPLRLPRAPGPRPLQSSESAPGPGLGQRLARGATGAALGVLPTAAAGYAIATLGGLRGGVLGGATSGMLGYLSGRQVYEAALKMADKPPEELKLTHRLALRLGAAAPWAWAGLAAATGAVAGATLSPPLAALYFAKKGLVAGAVIGAAMFPEQD